MTGQRRAYIDLSLAMAIVGSSVVIGKIITQAFPLFLASGLRFALAAAVLVPLARWKDNQFRRITAREWLTLTAMALCGQVLFTLFLLWGLRLTDSAEAGLITSTTPAAMAAVSRLVLKERLNRAAGLGVLLAVLGLLAVNGLFSYDYKGMDRARFLGNLLILAAVMGEAFFLLLRKTISEHLTSLTLSASLCLIGFLMFLPLAGCQALSFDFAAADIRAWGSILYFGLIFTVAAYLLWFRGVARVSGGTAGVFTAVMPVSAVLLSYLLLNEPFRRSHLVGGLMVVAAIIVMALGNGAKKREG